MFHNSESFYMGRIDSCPSYGFRSGEYMLERILRVIRADSGLTRSELNSIIMRAWETHKKMMEDNYNAGWSE